MSYSKIEIIGGVPTLTVNGQALSQTAYITYFPKNNHYLDFANAGYKMFSVPFYFAKRTINEKVPCPPFDIGIFEDETPNFEHVDKEINRILEACPDAMIFPRVNVNVSRQWELNNQNEVCDEGFSSHKCACFSSDLWAQHVKDNLSAFLTHTESAKYAEHIIGYQIAGGNTEEWMPLDPNGSSGKRSKEKYAKMCLENGVTQTEEGYYQFLSNVVAERICEFATYAKKLTKERVVIGAFYGYTLSLAERTLTHHALDKVLNCSAIDFLCSPLAYTDCRPIGQDHYCMVPVDSVKKHGKLYFSENDTRTHLSKAPYDIEKFAHPVWYGPSPEKSIEIIKMHYSRALVHGHANWWFDMWGGWYDDERYISLLSRIQTIAKYAVSLPRSSTAEVALFMDEKSFAGLCEQERKVVEQINLLMKGVGGMGTPYDAFLCSDIGDVADKYKLLICYTPVMTESILNVLNKYKNIPTIILGPDDNDEKFSSQVFYNACKEAGVYLYTDRPQVVYASKSFLFVHTTNDGELNLKDVLGNDFIDLFTNEKLTFPKRVKKGESYLFRRNYK